MKQSDYNKTTEELFQRFQKFFPHLRMSINRNHQYVDLSMDINKQIGLKFDINLNLQTDELFLETDHFRGSWSPLKDKKVIELFEQTVVGIINGNYRIVQLVKKDTIYRNIIQKEIEEQWTTVSTEWLKFNWPWNKLEKSIIRNI